MNIKLNLQFDGTDYHGWQIQKTLPTIQGELSRALRAITGENIIPVGCGRTDAGVHAEQYIASFITSGNIPVERIPYALNANLPSDIICKCAEPVSDSFNAAASARSKTYRYRIDNGEFEDVFTSRYAWHIRSALNMREMEKAANAFLGTHDFIGFASSGFSVKTTVRTIYSVVLSKDGSSIIIDITGNGFLYNMVRIIIGTLVYVGCGRISAADMSDIIASKNRSKAGITAPAKGLCLKEVLY